MSFSLLDLVQSGVPELWTKFKTGETDAALACYVICQLLAEYTEGDGRGLYSDPFLNFTEVPSVGLPGLVVANPKARVFVAPGCKFNKVVVSGSSNALIYFGNDTEVKNSEIACHSLNNVFFSGFSCKLEGIFAHIYAQHGFIVLCPGVTMQPGCNICVQENSYVIMGSDSMLSNNVFVRTSDSHGIYDLKTRIRNNPARPVVLHPHAWISRAVTLNKGTEVGRHSIIGQGSVVHGKLAGHSVYAGAPATKVRGDVTWDRRLALTLEQDYDANSHHFLATFVANVRRQFHGDSFEGYNALATYSLCLANRLSSVYTDHALLPDSERTLLTKVSDVRELINKRGTDTHTRLLATS